MAVFYQGRPLTIGTLGLLRSDIPLTVGVDGILEPLFITIDADITVGGEAGITVSLGHVSTGIVITGGAAPIVVAIGGQLIYDYKPSAVGTVLLGGHAHLIARENGILTAIYQPIGGEVISGTSNISITMLYNTAGGVLTGGEATAGYFANNTHIAGGGVIINGSAGVDFNPIDVDRGGRGVPVHRRRTPEKRHIYYYTSGYYLHEADRSIPEHLGGEATVMFIPAKYQFIKTLPRLPRPELIPDSAFRRLYNELQKQQKYQKFKYEATGGISVSGQSTEEYFDFTNFIITHDDELIIADILTTDANPFLTTRYDHNLSRRKKEDDELLEILELF